MLLRVFVLWVTVCVCMCVVMCVCVSMGSQVKRAIVENARDLCRSVRVGGKNPKSLWWNN